MLTPVPIFSRLAVLRTSVVALSSSFLYLRVRRVLESLTKASEHSDGVSLFHCLPVKDKRSVAAILILWFGGAFTRHGSEYIFF